MFDTTESNDTAVGAVMTEYEERFVAHYADALRLAVLFTHDGELARDVVQDAFLRIFGRVRQLRDPDAFLAYLRRTVVNAAIDVARSRQAERAREDRFVRLSGSDLVVQLPFDSVADSERELLGIVRRLPPRQQAVVVLRYWLDLSEAEIARTLRCRRGTVKSLAARALAALREEVERG